MNMIVMTFYNDLRIDLGTEEYVNYIIKKTNKSYQMFPQSDKTNTKSNDTINLVRESKKRNYFLILLL